MKDLKCNKCGKLFSENDIVSEPEYDIGDDSISTRCMSPCCFTGYTEEW